MPHSQPVCDSWLMSYNMPPKPSTRSMDRSAVYKADCDYALLQLLKLVVCSRVLGLWSVAKEQSSGSQLCSR